MREVVFVDGCRSAFTRLGGGLRDLSETEIAAFVINALVKKTGILERGTVDGLFAGSAESDSISIGPARYAGLLAGLPEETPATFIEMQCGSAIASINHAAFKLALGLADVIIAGGMESYSTMPAKFSMSQEPYKLIPPTAIMPKSAPKAEDDLSMIEVNEKMALKWGISREACDEFALRSQQRMAAAYKNGITGDEIVPYIIPATRKSPEMIIDKDEQPRPDTTLEGLRKLPPLLDGVTTAGNASGRNDGAAFVLMMTLDKAAELGYRPLARWVTGADVGCSPQLMGIGAAYSMLKAAKQASLRLSDFDVFECNEAFAAQNLSVIKEMQGQTGETIDREKWNPNGGAIAIGHPNGASGARIAMFAMRQLIRTGGSYGIFGSCCGGGLGVSTVIENLVR